MEKRWKFNEIRRCFLSWKVFASRQTETKLQFNLVFFGIETLCNNEITLRNHVGFSRICVAKNLMFYRKFASKILYCSFVKVMQE